MQTTFKRFEKKYMITTSKYDQLMKAISSYIESDNYSKYTVSNIYYDTDNFSIIRNSIEKPLYKEKLRVRSYGVPKDKDNVFFELKKKYKKEVFKRRIITKSEDYNEYNISGEMECKNTQILSEIEYFINLTNSKPKLYLAYDREAYQGKEDKNIRITFDSKIRFRMDDLDLSLGDHGKEILPSNTFLMEIKVGGAMPLWLSAVLNELEIYPRSFSKYGYIYMNFLDNKVSMK